MIEIFAVTTRGLEEVSAAEIATVPQVSVAEIGYRRVAARCTGPLPPLLDLRTVDDIFLHAGTWLGISEESSGLGAIRTMSGRLNLYRVAAIVQGLRPIDRPPTFSVTANFVGARSYTTPEIKEACAAGITESHYGWRYTADDREADLNVRLFIEHDTAHVGVRLAESPLQNRPYKEAHVPGSLKPPVAASLVWLAGLDCASETRGSARRLIDPTCGAGTILIEAALWEIPAHGGDLDLVAVEATRTNARGAGVNVAPALWDARMLPLADGTAACVVTNPPWGRKVEVEADLRAFYTSLGTEIRRVLAKTGRAVVLTWAPDWVRAWPFHTQQETEISLYGRKPTVMVLTHEPIGV